MLQDYVREKILRDDKLSRLQKKTIRMRFRFACFYVLRILKKKF